MLYPVHQPVVLRATDLASVRRVPNVRLDERQSESVQPVGGQGTESLPLPRAPAFAGDLIPGRGAGDEDHQVLGAKITPEQTTHVPRRRLDPRDGRRLLILRNVRLERQPVTRPAEIEGPLAEPPQSYRRRHQMLGREPSVDPGSE